MNKLILPAAALFIVGAGAVSGQSLVHQAEQDADRGAGRIVPQPRYELNRVETQDARVTDQVLADTERGRELAQADARAREAAGDQAWRDAQIRSQIQNEFTRQRVRDENDRAIRQEIRANQREQFDTALRRQQDANDRALYDESVVRDQQLRQELAAQRQAIEAGRGLDVAGTPSPLTGSEDVRQMIREEVARALAGNETPTTRAVAARIATTRPINFHQEEAIRLIRQATEERDRDLAAIGPGTTAEARGYRDSAERKYTNRIRSILNVYGDWGPAEAGPTSQPTGQ